MKHIHDKKTFILAYTTTYTNTDTYEYIDTQTN